MNLTHLLVAVKHLTRIVEDMDTKLEALRVELEECREEWRVEYEPESESESEETESVVSDDTAMSAPASFQF